MSNFSSSPLSPVATSLALIYFLFLWVCFFWIIHINGTIHIQHVTFYVWLLLPNIMFLRIVYVIAYISISFLCMAEQYSTVQIYLLFVHSSIDGHFVIVSSAAVDTHVQIFVLIPVFSFWVLYLGVELLSHMVLVCCIYCKSSLAENVLHFDGIKRFLHCMLWLFCWHVKSSALQ